MKKFVDYKQTLDLIKVYRWNSLIFKFSKRILLYILIPFLLLSAIIFSFYINEYKREGMKKFETVSSYIDANISNTFENIGKTTTFISSNRSVNGYFKVENLDDYNHQNHLDFIDTLAFTNAFIINSENIEDIYLYSYASDSIISSKNGGKIDDNSEIVWYDCLKNGNNTNFYLINDEILYIGRDINYKTGVAVFAVRSNSFVENYDNFEITFLDNASKNLSETQTGFFEKDGYAYFSKKYGEIEAVVRKKIDYAYYEKNIIFLSIVCIFSVILFAVIITFIISDISYKNIEDIINVIHKDDIDAHKDNDDELSYIIKNISRVSKENTELTTRLAKNFSEIKKLNSVILQNQISPHFLMNTLNTVNLIILKITKKKNEATMAVKLLAELFEDILKTNIYTFTIEEELSYCDKYLSIEKFLDDAFDVTYDVQEEVKNVIIPKLMLQPIVENAIKHGIKYLDNVRGKIHIVAKKSGSDIIITVSDNGAWHNSSNSYELDFSETKSIKRPSMGLSNTDKRIKLIYGDNYGVTLERKGDITVATVKIPMN